MAILGGADGILKGIYHLGYAVEDLAAAVAFYRESFGVEPSEPEEVRSEGILTCMFRVGDSTIELMQPTRPDSPVARFLARRGEGFHHVAFEVEDLEEALRRLKAAGVELIDEAPRPGAGGTRVAFIHPRGAFGVLTELVELGGREGG
ncbi:methylmalonyl-CoA epimerase [Rubrobacter xylanophilus]|uniref:Methylmalonyl-CoA epimerase n=1 Tax=Rubrobacter xylanophilus TaxID=49319 RepID=A0A510HFM7_9ACTN|nr:methylmalonyl-CoA epimerase [Rubrobacter xylanophilus]BBL78739.1 methylmalonyl-CoA epimerase [Rubrobacter xylanophilus]